MDPHPPMPTDRLLFLRRKMKEFRKLEPDEIWELFNAIPEMKSHDCGKHYPIPDTRKDTPQ